jgi:putative GTP pyrophosphokinase
LRDVEMPVSLDSDEDLPEPTLVPPPDEFARAVEVVDWWRREHTLALARVNANLRYYVVRAAREEARVTQRLKRFATVVGKLVRHPTMQLTTMEDIGGVRAVLADQAEVDTILADIAGQRRWHLRRIRQYIDGRDPGPKSDGYRAIHVVIERDGRYIEVQLRTRRQDMWAQSVERDTRRLGEGLKFGDGPTNLREYYRLVSDYFAMGAQELAPDDEFRRRMSRLYHETQRYYREEDE